MTTTPSDQSLKLALAGLLSDKIEIVEQTHGLDPQFCFFWRDGQGRQITDESWLHVCWMVEQDLRYKGDQFQWLEYTRQLFIELWGRKPTSEDCICSGLSWDVIHASWKFRAIALAKVKGVEL